MIKNERQYRITNAQAEKFAAALREFDEHMIAKNVHPILLRAEKDALRSQYDDLRVELAEYERLRAGGPSVIEANSWSDLPRALIQARIAIGISQRDLADRLALKEQQIQRYEATDYAGASLDRVRQVIEALGVTVREDVFLPAANVNIRTLISRLTKLGLDRDFIVNRLLPEDVTSTLETSAARGSASGSLAIKSAAAIGKIYNFSPASMFSADDLQLSDDALELVRFKVGARTDGKKLSAYTIYAHFVSLLALETTRHLPFREIPTDPTQVHADIVATYGTINLHNVIKYIWSLGITVLPLKDAGAFHGACWRADGRNVIVLKQLTQSNARWIVDLLHEMRHAAEEPGSASFSRIEDESLAGRRASKEEVDAITFSGSVSLGGRSEELADLCVKAANGSVERLKSAVPKVAAQEGVSVGALANYMAYRLSLQGVTWWPTANTLQGEDADPWAIARDVFLEHANFSVLNVADAELLRRALSER